MSSRVLRRRSATAAWIYAAVACGIVGGDRRGARSRARATSACSRPPSSSVGFFQTLLDLTVEESLTKYGFRYVAGAGLGASATSLSPGAAAQARRRRSSRRCSSSRSRRSPMRSSTPTASSRRFSRPRSSRSCSRPRTSARRHCSCTAATTCGASTRRDRPRSGSSPSSSPLPWVSTEALVAIVVAQAISTVVISAVGARGAAPVPVGAREGARRGRAGDPVVRRPVEPRDRRHLAPHDARPADPRRRRRGRPRSGSSASRQTPQTGLAAASSPARLVLLTEQTRDWEKGERSRVLGRAFAATRSGPARSWSWRYRCSSSRCRGSSGSSSARSTTARSTAARVMLRRRRDPLRAGLDEVPPGHDRAAATADRDPRARDARGDPARGRARGRVGRDGSRGRRPRFDARLRRRLARRDHASPRRGARGGRRDGAPVVRVVVVSGIWPPDPGGPASHAPALADFLAERGHAVEVVTTADSEPAARSYPVTWAARRSPLRHVRVSAARSRCRAPRRRRLRDEHDPASRDRRPSRAEAARREARVRRGLRARDAQRPLRRDARRVPARRRRRSAALPPRDAERGAEGSATRLLPELVPPRCRAALGARRRSA